MVPASPPQRVTVASTNSTADTFTAGSETFRYDVGDAFEFADAVITYQQFEALLTTGIVIDVRYEPTSEGVSSFNIIRDSNGPPAVNAQVGDFDGGSTSNDIRVQIVPPQGNSVLYDTRRAIVPASTATCEATTGRYRRVDVQLQGSYIDNNGSFIDKNLASGGYCYRGGVHNQTAHWTAFDYSAPVTMP